jgi:ribosomal protein S18 acetylase RimI-like enzyme
MSNYKQLNINDLILFAKQYPECSNYSDLMATEEQYYIDKYTFYGNESSFAGISPEGNFNIYGKSKRNLTEILDYLLDLKSGFPKLILGDSRLEGIINNKDVKVTKYNPWYCMTLKPTIKKEVSNVQELNQTQQELVNGWYESFNSDENSNWDTPSLAELGEKKLYALTIEDQFIGGCANTLVNANRLWIGRLYIKKEQRRKGYANILMDFIENRALESNRTVDLLVNTSNTSAINFYKNRGYSTYGINAYWCLEEN